MRVGLLIRVAAASGAVTVVSMPAGRGLAPLANVAADKKGTLLISAVI